MRSKRKPFTAEAQRTQRAAEKISGIFQVFLLFLCVLCASAVNEPAPAPFLF
jgi:hypothetical protein